MGDVITLSGSVRHTGSSRGEAGPGARLRLVLPSWLSLRSCSSNYTDSGQCDLGRDGNRYRDGQTGGH